MPYWRDDSSLASIAVSTEYLSPEQHGGIYGDIYRRYYNTPDGLGVGASVNISLGFTITGRVVSLSGIGVVEIQGGGVWYPINTSDYGGGVRNLEVTISSTAINIHSGSGLDWTNGGFMWVDYTK